MKHCYIIITQAFKEQHEGVKDGNNEFKTATTTDGRIVTSINAVNEFPALFDQRLRFTPLWLAREDFPEETIPNT